MTDERPRRFYETVSVREAGAGFAVFLDDRPVKTPAGNQLTVPVRPLAEGLALEWDAQRDRVRLDRMPLTRLVNTALEQTASRPRPVVDRLAAYGETDLLCHWADYPDELILRQRNAWQPMLNWAADSLGIRLQPVAGIRPVAQDAASLEVLRRHLEDLDPFSLTAVEAAAAVTGSVILALALAYGRLDAAKAWQISRIDEDYQMEKWGADEEAQRQAEARRLALDTAATVLTSLGPVPAQKAR